jgi:hypothetical protein
MIETQTTAFSVNEETVHVATFKNSLRQWQAQWKAQQAAAPTTAAESKMYKVRPRRFAKTARSSSRQA